MEQDVISLARELIERWERRQADVPPEPPNFEPEVECLPCLLQDSE